MPEIVSKSQRSPACAGDLASLITLEQTIMACRLLEAISIDQTIVACRLLEGIAIDQTIVQCFFPSCDGFLPSFESGKPSFEKLLGYKKPSFEKCPKIWLEKDTL